MKIASFGKRLICLSLSAACVLTSSQFALPAHAAAATGQFKVRIGDGGDDFKTFVSDTTVPAQMFQGEYIDYEMISDETFLFETPAFLFSKENQALPDILTARTGTSQNPLTSRITAALDPKITASVPDGSGTYTISPQVSKNTDGSDGDSFATATLTKVIKNSDQSDITPGNKPVYSIQARATEGHGLVNIINNASITFEISISSQKGQTNTTTIEEVSAGTGVWEDYYLGQSVSFEPRDPGDENAPLVISVKAKPTGAGDARPGTDLYLTLTGLPAVEPEVTQVTQPDGSITEVTTHRTETYEITIEFRANGPHDTRLQVYDPERAPEMFREYYQSSTPDYAPPDLTYAQTAQSKPLTTMDLLEITGDFTLARELYLYGAKFRMVWQSEDVGLINPRDHGGKESQDFTYIQPDASQNYKLTAYVYQVSQMADPDAPDADLIGGGAAGYLGNFELPLFLIGKGHSPRTLITRMERPVFNTQHLIMNYGSADKNVAFQPENGHTLSNYQWTDPKSDGTDFPELVTMDVFNGLVEHPAGVHLVQTFAPHFVDGLFYFGDEGQQSDEVQVTADVEGVLMLRAGDPLDTSGQPLSSTPVSVPVTPSNREEFRFSINPNHKGAARVHVTVKYLRGGEEVYPPRQYTFVIEDNSPSSNANLMDVQIFTHPLPTLDTDELAVYQEIYNRLPSGRDLVPDQLYEPAPDFINTTDYTLTLTYHVNQIDVLALYEQYSDWAPARRVGIQFDNQAVQYVDTGTNSQLAGTYNLTDTTNATTSARHTLKIYAEADDKTTRTYTINIVKTPPNAEAALKNITVEITDPTPTETTPAPAWNPEYDPNVTNYVITVPFDTEKVKVTGEVEMIGASKIEILKDGETSGGSFLDRIFAWLQGVFSTKVSRTIELNPYDDSNPDNIINSTVVRVVSTPERDGEPSRTYVLDIVRQPPSRDTHLGDLTLERKDRPIDVEESVTLRPAFNENQREYAGDVPYSTTWLRFHVTPKDTKSKVAYIEYPPDSGNIKTYNLQSVQGPVAQFTFTGLGQSSTPDPALNEMRFKIWVDAEDGIPLSDPRRDPMDYYLVTVYRQEPVNDGRLQGLEVVDADTGQSVPNYTFDRNRFSYDITVPFTTEQVMVTPTALHPEAVEVTINGKKIDETNPSYQSALTAGAVNTITVTIVPESGAADTKTYTLNITRELPATDASLADLKVENIPFLPVPTTFAPARTAYRIEIPEGSTTAKVIAEAEDENALVSISMGGKEYIQGKGKVEFEVPVSGIPEGVIEVTVTAEDGVTKQTYSIDFTNLNHVKLSTNALLSEMHVDYGSLSPKFTPTIFTYDLAVKPDASRVGYTPRAYDPKSKILVYREGDSRQIPTVDGKYWSQFVYYTDEEVVYNIIVISEAAQARLRAGRWTGGAAVAAGNANNNNAGNANAQQAAVTPINLETITYDKIEQIINDGFTAADTMENFESAGTDDNIGIRVYRVRVFLENEEVQYDLRPITEEDIDLTADPIIIDISRYAVIQASVFQTLKTDYADKTVILKGNDYTLEFNAGDININVPHTEQFDFRMQFTTPEKTEIEDILNASAYNEGIVPVYMYSDYHGTLPAPMLLTVNLGRQYANNQLYWNYFNTERNRIDYYGFVYTNAKGSFTVPVEHFSTYIITDQRIYNAENKSGVDYGGVTMDEAMDTGYGVQDMDIPPEANLGYAIGATGKENPDTGADSRGAASVGTDALSQNQDAEGNTPRILQDWQRALLETKRKRQKTEKNGL